MTTETLVTIDDTTLTTITGGRQSDATMNATCWRFWGSAGCPPKHSVSPPAAPSAPKTPYQRPGFPYATESRL